MPAAAAAAELAASGPAPAFALELALDPEAAGRLTRHPALAAARAGRRGRSLAEELIWLDTPEGTLAAKGLAIEAPKRGPRRRLVLLPDPVQPWRPGTPAEAAPAGEEATLPGLVPIAAFTGRCAVLPLGTETRPLAAALHTGKLRAVADERPAARLLLTGAEGEVLALARRLAADLPLLPAAAALAEEGRALARGEDWPRPRRNGPPDLGTAATVEDALVAAIGHLLEVMLHFAPRCRQEAGPTGVHQMRVALRRLRSVLKAFRPAARCPEVTAFDTGLGRLAKQLGTARDLDVFLGGLGAEAAAALPGDRRIAALLRAMEARRAAAYAALRQGLDGAAFRLLVLDGVALLLERPWRAAAAAAPEAAVQRETLAEPLPEFACRLLDKRWHQLCSEGEEIEALDAEALHELRLTAKRLRYAAELFAPLWPGKAARRFLKRLSALQEALGVANDTAVARGLVAGLGPAVPAWAVGAVEGFAAARGTGARRGAHSSWEDLMDARTFWSHV